MDRWTHLTTTLTSMWELPTGVRAEVIVIVWHPHCCWGQGGEIMPPPHGGQTQTVRLEPVMRTIGDCGMPNRHRRNPLLHEHMHLDRSFPLQKGTDQLPLLWECSSEALPRPACSLRHPHATSSPSHRVVVEQLHAVLGTRPSRSIMLRRHLWTCQPVELPPPPPGTPPSTTAAMFALLLSSLLLLPAHEPVVQEDAAEVRCLLLRRVLRLRSRPPHRTPRCNPRLQDVAISHTNNNELTVPCPSQQLLLALAAEGPCPPPPSPCSLIFSVSEWCSTKAWHVDTLSIHRHHSLEHARQ